ncbi:MAG: hypothetical protein ACRD25_08365 [Terracidiphilus sp.]
MYRRDFRLSPADSFRVLRREVLVPNVHKPLRKAFAKHASSLTERRGCRLIGFDLVGGCRKQISTLDKRIYKLCTGFGKMDVHFIFGGQRFCWNPEKAARNGGIMKNHEERIRQRLRKDRPMTAISIRIPEDVIEDMKELAPKFGFSGYQSLIRAYIGQGLRKDLARLHRPELAGLEENLRRHGVKEEVIAAVLVEAAHKSA